MVPYLIIKFQNFFVHPILISRGKNSRSAEVLDIIMRTYAVFKSYPHRLFLFFVFAIAVWFFFVSPAREAREALDKFAHLKSLAPRPGVLRAEIGGAWTTRRDKIVSTVSFEALSRAQDGEDIFAHDNFFSGERERDGIVVESGALDGLYFSNTFALEAAFGWRALHIEPGPGKFEELAHNRPDALNIHTALCAKSGTVHFLQMHDHDPVAGIVEFMSPEFRAIWAPSLDMSQLDENPHVVPVSCHPVRDVFAIFGLKHIDLWILDVEGGELSVLQTVDWSAVSIDVIVVELDGNNAKKDKDVITLLGNIGYVIYAAFKGRNTWFVSSAARGLRHKEGIDVPSALSAAFAQ